MKITTLNRLAHDGDLKAYCSLCLMSGTADGAFPAGRQDVTGGESAVVARDGEELLGFATYYNPLGSSALWLDLLWVERQHRRKSIGTKLVAAVIAEAQRSQMPLEFGTIAGNSEMIAFAESLGFRLASLTYRKDPVAH